MDNLIKNDKLKILILDFLIRNKDHSPSMLSSKLDYKHETIKNSLIFLELIGFVKKNVTEHGQKEYEYYNITDSGKKIFENNLSHLFKNKE